MTMTTTWGRGTETSGLDDFQRNRFLIWPIGAEQFLQYANVNANNLTRPKVGKSGPVIHPLKVHSFTSHTASMHSPGNPELKGRHT